MFVGGEVSDYGTGLALRLALLGLLVPFVVLVALHGRVRARRARFIALARANEEGLARLDRRWDDLAAPADLGTEDTDQNHPYARDLDVVGHASLARLVSAVTAPGVSVMTRWLLEPGGEEAIPGRQAAALELSTRLDLRDEVSASARGIDDAAARASPTSGSGMRTFLGWAEAEPVLADRRVLLWVTRIVPIVTLVLIAVDATGLIPAPLWLLSGGLGAWLALRHTKRIHEVFEEAAMREGDVRSISRLAGILVDRRFESQRLQELQDACLDEGVSAPDALRRLRLLLDLSEVRRSGLFHLPLHWIGLWDFHVLSALERWQRVHGRRVRGWLDAIGELDALSAMGALVFEQPEWTFPDLVAEDQPLRARGLGHPLLRPDVAVPNDVEIGSPENLLFVTGSNMSGKSTLLRSIGLNAVLAMAGGPVFARRMELPRVQVWTSMRVADDLERGVSQFLAEVTRVTQIVDATRKRRDGEPRVLFLLDEMLQGTNTAERRAAGRRVLRHLLSCGAFGAVTSHDLSLVDSEDLVRGSRAVHFSERVGGQEEGPALVFDYALRPGIATSTNALRILERLGLSGDPAPSEESAQPGDG